MPKRTVLMDSVGYVEKLDDGTTAHRYAFRGDEVELSDAEVSRLEELGAVGSEEDLRQAEAEAETTGPATPPDDDALRAMSVEEVSAHLTQHPGDVDRVDALEGERSKGRRKGVDELIESVREASAAAGTDEGTGDGSDEGTAGDGSSDGSSE